MGESKQKCYKQPNVAVLADREVCVTVGMGCGKKAMPEASGVPEGLCYSWASRSQGHCASCLEACLVLGLGSIRDRPAAWWLFVQECILSILSCNHPTLSAACCWKLVLPGCTRTFSLETLSFPAGFVWAAPQCSEAFSCPRAHIRLPLAAGLCWGLDVAPQLRKLPGSMLPANGKNVLVIVLACSRNSPAVSGWAQAAYCRMLRAISWAECSAL